MNYIQCPKCSLCVPITETVPIIALNKGKRIKVRVCNRCKENIEKEQNNKGNNE